MDQDEPNLFASRLRNWYSTIDISYPWRRTMDPYAILVSEIMLHRTRADQVRRVYEVFLERFPNIDSLLAGSREEIVQLLYPLGLKSRAGRLISAMQELKGRYGDVVPDRQVLMSVYGIGQYVAGAVSVFTRNQPEVLVDTNVVRVVGRVHGLRLDDGSRRRKEMIRTIEAVMDQDNPRMFYYAIIDLAHTICTPRDPGCNRCPLRDCPCAYAMNLETSQGGLVIDTTQSCSSQVSPGSSVCS